MPVDGKPFENLINILISTKTENIQEALILEKINTDEPGFIAQFLSYLWKETLQKKEIESRIYMSFIQIIHRNNLINTGRVQLIREFATNNELQEVGFLLDNLTPAQTLDRNMGVTDNLGMEEVPLGVRKSLAKKIDKRILNRLIHEQDVSVIEILLQNPSLVEMDVMKIVTKRPTSQDVIKQVFLDRKWISRYTIKRAIVLNPYSPPNLSIALLPFLQKIHIKEVMEDTSLHEALRLISQRALLDQDFLS